ncbi:hypothetical protein QFC21_006133 [Naganishia friedmannii]|uniref:Uncharacterized protein n=1 Tax=Naganishia friedmannii TaxID=89922 RepID=A0ACC2V4V1_9TREE|nr:hypothetical protein QFC21_006133 [Naganishia friedmannii]
MSIRAPGIDFSDMIKKEESDTNQEEKCSIDAGTLVDTPFGTIAGLAVANTVPVRLVTPFKGKPRSSRNREEEKTTNRIVREDQRWKVDSDEDDRAWDGFERQQHSQERSRAEQEVKRASVQSEPPVIMPVASLRGNFLVNAGSRRPGSQQNNLSPMKAEPSAFSLRMKMATAIEDIQAIAYSSNISPPSPALNRFAPPGKFRFDRAFLLQFGQVCRGRIDVEIPLDMLGINLHNPPRSDRSFGRGIGGNLFRRQENDQTRRQSIFSAKLDVESSKVMKPTAATSPHGRNVDSASIDDSERIANTYHTATHPTDFPELAVESTMPLFLDNPASPSTFSAQTMPPRTTPGFGAQKTFQDARSFATIASGASLSPSTPTIPRSANAASPTLRSQPALRPLPSTPSPVRGYTAQYPRVLGMVNSPTMFSSDEYLNAINQPYPAFPSHPSPTMYESQAAFNDTRGSFQPSHESRTQSSRSTYQPMDRRGMAGFSSYRRQEHQPTWVDQTSDSYHSRPPQDPEPYQTYLHDQRHIAGPGSVDGSLGGSCHESQEQVQKFREESPPKQKAGDHKDLEQNERERRTQERESKEPGVEQAPQRESMQLAVEQAPQEEKEHLDMKREKEQRRLQKEQEREVRRRKRHEERHARKLKEAKQRESERLERQQSEVDEEERQQHLDFVFRLLFLLPVFIFYSLLYLSLL